MLNISLLRQWITELRSGKWKQGKIVLRAHDDRFCCWGVLCNLVSADRWVESDRCYAWGTTWGTPPLEVEVQTGLTRTQTNYLMTMNDTQDKTFNEIADQIETWIKEQENVIVAQAGTCTQRSDESGVQAD